MDIIKHLRELRARATQGEWSQRSEDSNYVDSDGGLSPTMVCDCYDRTDAALIVAAVNTSTCCWMWRRRRSARWLITAQATGGRVRWDSALPSARCAKRG